MHTTANTDPECSNVHRYLAHEAGHVFGISNHPSIRDVVMDETDNTICNPTPYDILAIMALYQSQRIG